MVRKKKQPARQPIPLPGTRRQKGAAVPLTPITRGEMSAEGWLKYLTQIHGQAERVGRMTPYEAHRCGYYAGGIQAICYLEALLDVHGFPLGTALESVRAYWERDIFQWVNAPDDPQEIIPAPHNEPDSNSPTSPPSAS